MTDDRSDEGLGELRGALSVRPSAGFAAHLRAQVEQNRQPAWTRRTWALLIAVAVLGVMVAPGWVMDRLGQTPSVVPPSAMVKRAAVEATRQTPVIGAVPGSRSQGSNRPPPSRVRETVAQTNFEVLVPPDQEIAIRRMLAALREGRPVVPPAPETLDLVIPELPAPSAVDIPLINVEPLPGSTTGGGGRN